jgi:hypothetical protein
MVDLGLQLLAAYGVGATAFGIKGNTAHLSGGHRSQEWLRNSAYCTNRTYTVQSGLTVTQARMCVAFDFTPGVWGTPDNRAKMIVLTRRLIDAQKAGQLDELDEVFGTLDGVRVTGWNNDSDSTITADSSHLDHIHGRFDRRYADDNTVVAKVAAIMLGDDMADTVLEWNTAWMVQRLVENADPVVVPANASIGAKGFSIPNALARKVAGLDTELDTLRDGVANLAIPAPAPVDPASLKAVLLEPEVLAALAKAVNDDAAQRFAE